jgi:hypothetical protein
LLANKRTIYRLLILLYCNLLYLDAHSQNKDRYSLSCFEQWGWVIPTNDFVKGNNSENSAISQIRASSLRFTQHTSGKEYWHKLFNYPSYGLGLLKVTFNIPNQLGEPIALYGFFTKPIFTTTKLRFYADYSVGVAFNWLHYSIKHQDRTAMGGYVSCYIDVSVLLKRMISKEIDLGIGLSLSHYSNGAMRKPNYGINLLSSKISIDYLALRTKPIHYLHNENFNAHFTNICAVFVGSHNVLTKFSPNITSVPFDRRSYVVAGVDWRFLRRFNYKHTLGFGFGIGYNQYVGTTYRIIENKPYFSNANPREKFNLSTYISYEYRIHHLGLILEPGIYLYKSRLDESNTFFQRIGLRYYFKDNSFVAINLRAANFSVAQYIEWSFGYSFENL